VAELNQRDARLVQWLQEAYTKEAELEASLTQHIGLTQKASYKKRLQDHLKETRDHKRRVERRIKQLGGTADTNATPIPGPVGEVVGKTVSIAKGQLGMARAAITQQVETHLRNAQEELREEHVEIALYTRLETLATEVGDRDTATLAKGIRRDEERMAKFLDSELSRLVKELVRKEIPRDQRPTTSRRSRRRSTTSRSASSTRSSSASSRAASRSTTSRAKSTTSRAKSTTSRAKSGTTSRAKSTTSRAKTGTSRSGSTTRRRSSAGSR
jgi:ferritin-like metal-binding protein YciE